jgi:nuclear-control-of-ATPase protein 2
MTVDYARDHSLLSDTDLAQLPSRVRDGDLSIILQAYESSIRSPIKSVVAGDMLRLILIQVRIASLLLFN